CAGAVFPNEPVDITRQQIQIDPVDGHSGTKRFGDTSHPDEQHLIEHGKALLNLLSARSAAESYRHYVVDSTWTSCQFVSGRGTPPDSTRRSGLEGRRQETRVTAWTPGRGRTSVRNHFSESAMAWARSGSSTP